MSLLGTGNETDTSKFYLIEIFVKKEKRFVLLVKPTFGSNDGCSFPIFFHLPRTLLPADVDGIDHLVGAAVGVEVKGVPGLTERIYMTDPADLVDLGLNVPEDGPELHGDPLDLHPI